MLTKGMCIKNIFPGSLFD